MEKQKINYDFKQNFINYLTLTTIALFCIIVCSSNSFLHFFNDSAMLNYNITVAEAMLSGTVPYKDIFTQNGPVVLSVFAICALIKDSYIAIFILELLCAYVFVNLIFKLANKHLNASASLVATGVVAILTYTASGFMAGGVVEEFLLPVFTYLLICLYEYIFENKQFSILRASFIGLSLALILWCNPILLVLPIIMILAWVVLCIKNKQTKQMFGRLTLMFTWVVIISLLMIWYLFIIKALEDFVTIYFSYKFDILTSLKNIASNAILLVLAIASIVLGLIFHKLKFLPVAIVEILYIFSLLFTASESSNVLPLAIFALIGVIYILKLLIESKCLDKTKHIALMVVAILSIAYCFIFSNSIRETNRPSSEYAQVEIAEDILGYNIENATLLCYNLPDMGFYTYSGLLPTTKKFAVNQYLQDDEEMLEVYDEMLSKQSVDFVLMEKEVYEENKTTYSKNYDKVGEYTYNYIDDYKTTEYSLILLKK